MREKREFTFYVHQLVCERESSTLTSSFLVLECLDLCLKLINLLTLNMVLKVGSLCHL